MKGRRWRWLGVWLASALVASCHMLYAPSRPPCLTTDAAEGLWGRGNMCRVSEDCPQRCDCRSGYCIVNAGASDAGPDGPSTAPPDGRDAGNHSEQTTDISPDAGHGDPRAWVKRLYATQGIELRKILPSHDGHLLLFGHFRGSLPCQTDRPLVASGPEEWDLFLWKVTTKGATVWCQRYGGEGDDMAASMARDKLGDVYLLASTRSKRLQLGETTLEGRGKPDVALFKVSSSGQVRWARLLTKAYDAAPGIVALDLSGDVYAGWNQLSDDLNRQTCTLMKLTRDGAVSWLKEPLNRSCVLHSVASHPAGGLVFSGTFRDWWPGFRTWRGEGVGTVENSVDLFLASLDASGAIRWGLSIGTEADDEEQTHVTVTPDGTMYWAGHFGRGTFFTTGGGQLQGLSQRNGFLSQVSKDGRLQWIRRLAGTAQATVQISDLLWRGERLWVGGHFVGSLLTTSVPQYSLRAAGEGDLFLAAIDDAGTWQQLVGIGDVGDERSGGWGSDASGQLFWGGRTTSRKLRLDGHLVTPLSDGQALFLWKMAP